MIFLLTKVSLPPLLALLIFFETVFFWVFSLLFTTWIFVWLKKGQIDYKRGKKWHTISRLINFDMISLSQSCYDNNLKRSKKVKLMDFLKHAIKTIVQLFDENQCVNRTRPVELNHSFAMNNIYSYHIIIFSSNYKILCNMGWSEL